MRVLLGVVFVTGILWFSMWLGGPVDCKTETIGSVIRISGC
jgi:hypothetical protein